MLKGLADSWWTFAVRGVIALLFGIGALSYPALTVFVLVIFFGAFVLVDGVTALVMGFGEKKRPAYVFLGLVSVADGGSLRLAGIDNEGEPLVIESVVDGVLLENARRFVARPAGEDDVVTIPDGGRIEDAIFEIPVTLRRR